MKGKLVVIEGGVGCGKTTQINLLKKDLKDWEFYRHPGGTEFGEKIRDAVQGLHGYEVYEHAALLAYLASLANLVQGVIIPRLKKGKNIVLDRYWYSTYSYQGSNGVPKKLVEAVSKVATAGLKPDLVVFYDLDPKIGMKRKVGRKDSDRYDIKGVEFHKKVRRSYHDFARKMGGRWKTIDAGKTIDEIHQETLKLLKRSKIVK